MMEKRLSTSLSRIQDGLAGSVVLSIHRDPDGVMWFGTFGGVSRYDGKFINFTTKDGLAHNDVRGIYRDPDGMMWFAAGDTILHKPGGVSLYDGKEFVNFTRLATLVAGRTGRSF